MVGGGWMVAPPSNFIIKQSTNPWILGFEILDLDFGLDNLELIGASWWVGMFTIQIHLHLDFGLTNLKNVNKLNINTDYL